MLFEREEPLDVRPLRTKTLLVSVGIHLLLVAVIATNPDFLTSPPKRIIRIAGQDYDLSKNQITELVVPPEARPKPPTPRGPKDRECCDRGRGAREGGDTRCLRKSHKNPCV